MGEGGYSRLAGAEMEFRERRGGGPSSSDVAGPLGAGQLVLRVWRYGAGHQMAYHRHKTQDEIYHLVSGGPQEVLIDGEAVTVQDGDWLYLPKDTPRRIQNPSSDRTAVWIAIGAPPGEGITDGIRLDPETGEEIPRT
jgi:quercetin dioxygenase-like cupin family protein